MSYAVMPLTDYQDMCDKVREKIPVNLLEGVVFEEEYPWLCSPILHLEPNKEYIFDSLAMRSDENTVFIVIAEPNWYAGSLSFHEFHKESLPYRFTVSSSYFSEGCKIFIEVREDGSYPDTTDVSLTKADTTIKSGEMPIKIEEVYEAGKAEGGDTESAFEAGKQAEYDKFWDVFQNNGGERNYYYKFGYTGWTDENFNPKYPIITTTGTTAGMSLFHANTVITDTKVPIIVKGSNAGSMFYNANKLVTVRCLNVHEGVALDSAFHRCLSLKNITFEGVIGQNTSFADSANLTDDSINSIIEHLKTLTSGTKTLTVAKAVYNRMVADGRDAIVTAKNWTLVSA